MDDPTLDPNEHRRALAGLRRINAWSGTAAVIWGPIREACKQAGGRVLRVLDVASGGGDIALGLWRRAHSKGLRLQVTGCDRSPVAVETARIAAERCGAAVRFEIRDVIAEGIPRGYDVVMSTLFLHHLSDDEAAGFLRAMAQSGASLLMVDDLTRGGWGYMLAWTGSRLLSRSRVVHADALKSVEAAWTPTEAKTLATAAGWTHLQLRRHWPARYLLQGRPG